MKTKAYYEQLFANYPILSHLKNFVKCSAVHRHCLPVSLYPRTTYSMSHQGLTRLSGKNVINLTKEERQITIRYGIAQ